MQKGKFMTKPGNGTCLLSFDLKRSGYAVTLYKGFPEMILSAFRSYIESGYDFSRHYTKTGNQINLAISASYYDFGIVQIGCKLYFFRTQPEGPELKPLKIVADVSPRDSALVQVICLLEAAVRDIEEYLDDWITFSKGKADLTEQICKSKEILEKIKEEEFYSLIDWDYSDELKDYCEWKIDPVSPNQILNPHVQERENIVTAKYCPCCGKVIKAIGM